MNDHLNEFENKPIIHKMTTMDIVILMGIAFFLGVFTLAITILIYGAV